MHYGARRRRAELYYYALLSCSLDEPCDFRDVRLDLARQIERLKVLVVFIRLPLIVIRGSRYF